MKKIDLARLFLDGVAFDTETHLTQAGLAAPPLVCASIAALYENVQAIPGQAHPGIRGELLDKEGACEAFLSILESNKIIIGAHLAYDMLVMATHFWRTQKRDIFPLLFAKYERGEVFDILIAEALNAIADGHLGKDPWTGGDLRGKNGRPQKYYSLDITVKLTLDREDAKANDEWRTKYAILEHIAIANWPPSAATYPVDDACNSAEAAFAQCGFIPKRSKHRWVDKEGHATCTHCEAVASEGAPQSCFSTRRHRNLHQMADQAYTAFVLHLGSAWGFTVDQDAVDVVMKEVEKTREVTSVPLIEAGLLKWKKDKGELKLGSSKGTLARAVAVAYGASGTCSVCDGTGKVVSANKKMPVKRAWDPEKDGVNCKECCATGLDLATAPMLKLTEPSEMYPKGNVSADRDSLNESGDDVLQMLADYGEDAKTITNYGPYLRKAQIEVVGADGVVIRYPRPLNLRANVILETDRVSYSDAIQQFPRSGGLRACITARKGYVLCSVDYNQGEVITHAQSVLWILGHSRQAEIVLEGKEVHSMFGSEVLGVTYDEFFKNKKTIKSYTNARQAAKPWVFGRPGGMGIVKLVQAQRKQGPDTASLNGPVMIWDEDNECEVRGYRGLRFCILMDNKTSCGSKKTTSWGSGQYARTIAPTCVDCLNCASRLDLSYKESFPEIKDYFKYTTSVSEDGQHLTDEQCVLFDLPNGSQLAPGEMVQHVSDIIRGGVQFNDCSNGYFQSLLAVASKMAMRIAQRECCDSSVRVPEYSKFAGQKSPLYGSRCIVLQHDEIIAELLEVNMHTGALRLSEIMVWCLQVVCPDMASAVKAPPALMRRWYKSAEPVYVNEQLIPWEPKPKKKKEISEELSLF